MLTAVLAATLLNATYVSEACGFSFDYPSKWAVVANPRAQIKPPPLFDTVEKCAVGLQPPGWRKEMRESEFALHAYPVRVIKWNKGFLRAAHDSYFRRIDDDGPWSIDSRGGPTRVEEFRTACCQGLRGHSWARIWSRTHQVGSYTWEAALVNDRRGHSVIIESDRDDAFQYVVTDIILSVRFHEAKP